MHTMVLQRVKRVSNNVFNAVTVSSTPSSPFNLFRLNRMYQFVNSSMRSSKRGMMVYRRYAAISSRTSLMSDWQRARIQRSMTFFGWGAWGLYLKSTPLVFFNRATCPKKKRKELSQGRRTRDMTSRTPSSRNRRLSPRTMGELTRNILYPSISKAPSEACGIPSRIGAILLNNYIRIRIVFQTFAHFLAIPVIDEWIASIAELVTHAASTSPVTMRFLQGALPNRCVERTSNV